MKIFVIFSAIIMLLYITGYIIALKRGIRPYQIMDREHTNVLKGFSIILVIWAHCGANLGVEGIQFIAAIGVALFLFCSGYGLMCSYINNKLTFYWRKRVLRVVVPCWIADVFFIVYERNLSWKRIIDGITLKNSNWFIIYIIICYTIFWSVCRAFMKKKASEVWIAISSIVIFGAWFILESFFFAENEIPFLRARQMLLFPLGIVMAVWKDNILEKWNFIIKRKYCNYYIIGTIFLLTLCGCLGQILAQTRIVKQLPLLVSNLLYLVVNIALSSGVFLCSVLFIKLFANVFLQVLGNISYELFLIHLPFIYRMQSIESIIIYGILLIIAAFTLHLVDNIIFSVLKNG